MTLGNDMTPPSRHRLGYSNYKNDNHDADADDDDLSALEPLPQRVLDFTSASTSSPKRISHVQFGLLSAADMERLAECPIHRRDLYTLSSVAGGPPRAPAAGGCLDPRLGVSNKVARCETCQRGLQDCAGHFGYIPLSLPVFHIGFLRHTLYMLQAICKTCARLLITPTPALRHRIRTSDVRGKQNALAHVLAQCKKVRSCPHCGALNGTVKRVTGAPTLRIIHERFKKTQKAAEEETMDVLLDCLQTAMQENADVQAALQNPNQTLTEDLLPTRVLELFRHMTEVDMEYLWMDPIAGGKPADLILQSLLVPPVPIRPSVAMDVGGGSNEDDLTVKLQEILDVNTALSVALSHKGPASKTIIEIWDFLQVQVAQYMNGDLPGLQRMPGQKPVRGLCQRLKGKQGRFRGNLSGKRVDFSARTVISPDPNLGVAVVGVPRHVAKIMTYPCRVSRYNMEHLRQLVRNGPDDHPGANFVRTTAHDGSQITKSLAFGDRHMVANRLKIGDIVERHMMDDDIVLFNRQPSLHRVSIMAHRVKVLDWRTFRFNTIVCAPYNADFDGDEMNLHLPQTEEARAEASLLLSVPNNLTTPRNGEPLVAAAQDFLSASFLLTQKDQFFNREEFCQLVAYFGDAGEHVDLPTPAVLKPIELWTGKQVFGMMLRPNKKSKIFCNFETKDKNYSKHKYSHEHFDPNDGYVAFRNSELISGNIAKKTLGDGSKTGLIYVLRRDFGVLEASRCMDRWAKFCSRYMGAHKGLSIGISDVTPSSKVRDIKHKILSDGYAEAFGNIDLYNRGELELRPGCDLLQSLEEVVNGLLGRLRNKAGDEAMEALPWSNAPRIMAACGAKGSPLNISQMVACVGQQAVGSKRIQNGFVDRTLPHFEWHSLTPPAKGFVANSFYTGLTATEFFFHMMAGREGLVDTAVKTAETGYMQRRLVKALEDLSMQYDSSVRNSEKNVVQFTYGDDGLDPNSMEQNARPVLFERVHLNVMQTTPCLDEPALSSTDLLTTVARKLKEQRFQALLPSGQPFLDEIETYFGDMADKLCECERRATPHAPVEFMAWSSCRMTPTQLDMVLDIAHHRYVRAVVEAGEAVGAIAAQSIGEPGTQMTLKTFHFSGISSMNVTLGVPRLKEIINAAKLISTPIITATLECENNKVVARIVKASIEKTTLGQVSKYFEEVYSLESCYIGVELDLEAIEQLKLNVTVTSVRDSILNANRGDKILRSLEASDVKIKRKSKSKLRVYVPSKVGNTEIPSYFGMQMLKAALPNVIVQGIPSVNRAVISEKQDKNGKAVKDDMGNPTYNLYVEGYGFLDVMGSPGIDGLRTVTNHVLEVEQVLGVEAARTQITAEILFIMKNYGIGIDTRHMLLLSDVMTFKGEVLGITRFGISKIRESVFMLASFEKTTDHLFDAAVHGRTDAIVGVSECIIMGMEVPVGTGLPSLFWQEHK